MLAIYFGINIALIQKMYLDMSKQILFFQGGGEDGYNADKAMVASLKKHLGKDYAVHYNEIQSDESLPDYGWKEQIGKQLAEMKDDFILAGHSLGASTILKYLSEHSVDRNINGIFLLSTPFWNGNEAWKAAFKLKDDFAEKLPKQTPVFFYQSMDDEEVPFDQFKMYREKLPIAIYREIEQGGHQLNNDLAVVAEDIKALK